MYRHHTINIVTHAKKTKKKQHKTHEDNLGDQLNSLIALLPYGFGSLQCIGTAACKATSFPRRVFQHGSFTESLWCQKHAPRTRHVARILRLDDWKIDSTHWSYSPYKQPVETELQLCKKLDATKSIWITQQMDIRNSADSNLNHSNIIGSISYCQRDSVLHIFSHKRYKVSLLQRWHPAAYDSLARHQKVKQVPATVVR
jgi:hypothetical protein